MLLYPAGGISKEYETRLRLAHTHNVESFEYLRTKLEKSDLKHEITLPDQEAKSKVVKDSQRCRNQAELLGCTLLAS